MIEKGKFQSGMHSLGAAFAREMTDEVLRVYDKVLSAKLDDAGFERAVERSLQAETFFPPPAVLLRYGLSDATPPTALAGRAYEAIVDEYEGGKHPGFRQISAKHGRAAAEAFVAAGGYNHFAWCEPKDEPFRRKEFVKAFVEMVQAEPTLALPAGDDTQALPEGK